MNFIGEKCPVCNKAFTDKDDIAVCPICGTPHHRECYLQSNNCFNEARHGEGYEWTPEVGEKLPTIEHIPVQNKVFCPYCGSENAAEEPVCTNCGARLYNNRNDAPFPFPGANTQGAGFGTNVVQINPNDILGGHTVSDTAEYIQSGADRYIPKFYKMEKTGKRISFNWAAFIFGQYWFFFRKMTKIGIFISLAVILITALCTTPRLTDNMTEYQAVMEEYYQGKATSGELAEAQQAIISLVETKVLLVSELLIHLFCGLYANTLYKNKVQQDIGRIKATVHSEEEYRGTLFRSGGVSALQFILSVFCFTIASEAVSMLISMIR